MTYWLDRKRGVLARCLQYDADGTAKDGQEELADDHPDVLAMLNFDAIQARTRREEREAYERDRWAKMTLEERVNEIAMRVGVIPMPPREG